MLELNKVYLMDCMEGMREIPDKYFELAIVDPPYGIGVAERGWMNYKDEDEFAKRISEGKKVRGQGKAIPKQYSSKTWDKAIPDKNYFDELIRVSENQIIWGGNYFVNHLNNTPCFIVWDKNNNGNYFADCELAWTSFDSAVRKFTFTWNGMLQQNMGANKEERIHPTQKPICLYQWLLRNYAKPGDKILDTHMGSGSSIIACHDMGFEYMAFEIDADYYTAAVKRINEHKAQIRMTL